MAEGRDAGLRSREPLLLGVGGALIGVLLAVALVVFGGLGGGPADADGSPSAPTQPSAVPSLVAEASPSTEPTAGLSPSPVVTLAPTAAPRRPGPRPRRRRPPRRHRRPTRIR